MNQRKKRRNLMILFVVLNILVVGTLIAFNVKALADKVYESNSSPTAETSEKGLGLLAAALSTGLAAVGAGIAVGRGSAAAIAATVENPEMFGKALIYVALGEGIAIYGILISFLIFGYL